MDNGIYPVCFYFTSRLIPFTVSTSFTLFLEKMWRDSGISLRETKFEELEERQIEDWDSEKLRWFIENRFQSERIWNARVSDIRHEESIKTLENNPRWSRERERAGYWRAKRSFEVVSRCITIGLCGQNRDSRFERDRARRRGSDWLDFHCVGFCPFASPSL